MKETNRITAVGLNDLVKRIVNREILPPEKMTVASMNAWLNGYAKCQMDVLDIIDGLRGDMK